MTVAAKDLFPDGYFRPCPPRRWLGSPLTASAILATAALAIAALGIATLALSGGASATVTDLEQGRSDGTVCEGEVLYYFNLTVTNDDSVESDYDLRASAAGLEIEPGAASFTLNYDESETTRFSARVERGSSYKNIDVRFDISSSNGSDASESANVTIERCTSLHLEPLTAGVVGRPGDWLALAFTLTDNGNDRDRDRIALRLTGLPADWEAEYPGNLSLDGGQAVNLTLIVTPGSAGTARLQLTASTDTPGANLTSATVEVESQGFFRVYRLTLLVAGGGAAAVTGVSLYYRRHFA